MRLKTITRLILATLVPGSIGILVAIYFNTATGYLSLLPGFLTGIVGTQIYYVPKFIKKWERIGIPGEPKTPEQQRAWEQERKKDQRSRNLSVLVGLIGFALLKQFIPHAYEEEFLEIFLPAIFGGLAGYVFRYVLLIYQKRGRLG